MVSFPKRIATIFAPTQERMYGGSLHGLETRSAAKLDHGGLLCIYVCYYWQKEVPMHTDQVSRS